MTGEWRLPFTVYPILLRWWHDPAPNYGPNREVIERQIAREEVEEEETLP